LGINARLFGCQASLGRELIEVAKDDAEGFESISCLKENADPIFVKSFESRVGDELSIFNSEPYFATRLLAEAIKRCGSDNLCIHSELKKIRNLDTPLGQLSMSPMF
jgi:ABC-type branched-subunit amino acid transport system substrate-binding protein